MKEAAVAESWHGGLAHPHQVDVAGQDGQVGVGDFSWGFMRTAVSDQDVDQQLQVALPPDRFSKQNDGCGERVNCHIIVFHLIKPSIRTVFPNMKTGTGIGRCPQLDLNV